MLEENLQKIGFSPSEIKIYLYLIKKGPSYPSKISSETKVNRTNVYEALDRLVSKGIISFIVRNKVKWFEAKSIDYLNSFIQEKADAFEKTKNDLIFDVKVLKKISVNKKESLEASIFVGKKALRSLFEEMLDFSEPIYFLASKHQFSQVFGVYFEQWHNKRIRKKIRQKSIFPKEFKHKLPKRKLLEYKFVNNEFTSPTTTVIYGDVCLLIEWQKEPLVIRIQNKKISKSHLNYFNLVWNS